ncbi:flagellar hook-associated protein FlgK [Chromatiales bacterium (ex Bugula neritina AB1)]|nr:flagellar hook-associated protein FlgK [Chromatiales bacterium (ex Bugula neritina AB1)]
MANPLSTSVKGLMAAGRAIATTSHNIANANTEGYSRQRVLNATSQPSKVGAGYIGTGVTTTRIERIHNEFVEKQLQNSTTELARLSTYNNLASQLDSLVHEDSSGINKAQIEFFNTLENSANYPQGMGQEEVVFSAANHLVGQFKALDRQLEEIEDGVHRSIDAALVEVNQITGAIHDINNQVRQALVFAQGEPPNDLLDQRDQLLQRLSGFTSVSTYEKNDGSIDVAIGGGIPLVSSSEHYSLTAVSNGNSRDAYEIRIDGVVGSIPLNNQINGGKLGGMIEALSEMITPVRGEIGRMATSLSSSFNQMYETSTLLPGSALFSVPQIVPLSDADNTGTGVVSAVVVDSSALTTSDYELKFDGIEYTVRRLSDNVEISGPGSLVMDGVQFTDAGGSAAGDRYIIRPTKGAASGFSVAVNKPADIVLTRTEVSGVVATVGQELSAIQNENLLGVNSSLAEQIAAVTVRVGSSAHTSDLQLTSMQQVWQQTRDRHDSTSAVNLDEEAANLVRFQQAYEASARVISVAGSLFDTLIGTLNRI